MQNKVFQNVIESFFLYRVLKWGAKIPPEVSSLKIRINYGIQLDWWCLQYVNVLRSAKIVPKMLFLEKFLSDGLFKTSNFVLYFDCWHLWTKLSFDRRFHNTADKKFTLCIGSKTSLDWNATQLKPEFFLKNQIFSQLFVLSKPILNQFSLFFLLLLRYPVVFAFDVYKNEFD